MPIYAYKCLSCQHAMDVLQKYSDAPLSICPECGAATMAKQLTAAGFQLKGSGWYATDFKHGAGGGEAKPAAPASGTAGADAPAAAPEAAPASAAAAPAKDAAAAPACGTGGCAACS
jgi:putative FmdB family regulatory protein